MGNHFNQSSLSISIQPSQYRLFDFHTQLAKKTNKSTMVFPSYIKRDSSHHIQYAQRCNFNQRQYEISLNEVNSQSLLILKRQFFNSERIWKVLDVDECMQLKEKDIIKLGQTELIVKKICKNYQDLNLDDNLKTVSELDLNDSYNMNSRMIGRSRMLEASKYYDRSHNHKLSSDSLIGDSACCRICFSQAASSHNPLFSLCKCSGSIKNVHYLCLKSWIKHTSKYQSCDSYEYLEYDLSCDICKTKIDKTVTHNNRKYTIYADYINHPPFVILGFKNDNSNKVRQYIINFDHKDRLLLGKDINCDIPLTDKFISRHHCQILYQNNKLFLKNLNPVFGTFVNFKQHSLSSNLHLMIKNTLIKIEKEKSNCCDINMMKIHLLDELQNENNQ